MKKRWVEEKTERERDRKSEREKVSKRGREVT